MLSIACTKAMDRACEVIWDRTARAQITSNQFEGSPAGVLTCHCARSMVMLNTDEALTGALAGSRQQKAMNGQKLFELYKPFYNAFVGPTAACHSFCKATALETKTSVDMCICNFTTLCRLGAVGEPFGSAP